METLWRDVRQTFRWMARQKGFTAAVTLTLALGIGANTAIFAIVYGVLLKPLPYADPDRLVTVWEEHPRANALISRVGLSDVTHKSWTRALRTLEGVAAYSGATYTVGREDPARLQGATVSPSLFPLLRVSPAAGRFFTPEEAEEGAAGVVVLSQRLWRSRFGRSPEAIGRSLFVEGRPRLVVGVAPPGFAFPSPETELWMPMENPQQRGFRTFSALGRLKPGVTPLQAAAEGTAAARAVPRPREVDLLFGKGGPVEVRVQPFVEEMTADIRPALLMLAVAVGLVLLIACANVSNLYLARSIARQRELAVRAALGAGRRRLAGQLLTESLVLSLCGGALGLLLAWGLTSALPALAPLDLPRLEEIRLDGRVLAFAGAASVLAGLPSGLVPAWRSLRIGPAHALRDCNRATSGAGKGLRGGLLVAEAALAVVLLIGAGLLLHSFVRLLQVDVGYEPDNVLTAQVYLPDAEKEPARNTALVSTLLARLKALPGVVAASAANMAPLGNSTSIMQFELPAGGPDGAPIPVRANVWIVTPDYGRTLGLRVRNGRFLDAGDIHSSTQALVVNEELVRRYLTDGKPVIGRRIPDHRVMKIVGVVGNILKDGPGQSLQPEIYFLAGARNPEAFQEPFLLVRTTGDPLALTLAPELRRYFSVVAIDRCDPLALAPELRRLVREIEPRAALDNVDCLTKRLSKAVAQPRFAALVLAVFAVLALSLAATGLYGVLTYSVSQRRHEMGIRAALGATPAGLLRLILRDGLALTVVGLALGLGAALGVTRLMASLLFGVTPLDAVAFAAAPLAMLGVATAACLIPARRAAAVDPAEALRSE